MFRRLPSVAAAGGRRRVRLPSSPPRPRPSSSSSSPSSSSFAGCTEIRYRRLLERRGRVNDGRHPRTFGNTSRDKIPHHDPSGEEDIRTNNRNSNNDIKDEKAWQAMFQEQMQELKEEREALFGFTAEDHSHWTNAHKHKHEESFLQFVNQARQEQQEQSLVHDADGVVETNLGVDETTKVYTGRKEVTEENDNPNDGSAPPTNQALGPPDPPDAEAKSDLPPPAKLTFTCDFSHVIPSSSSLSSSSSSPPWSIHMVNVGSKPITDRVAVAESRVVFPKAAWMALTRTTTPRTTTTTTTPQTNMDQSAIIPPPPLHTEREKEDSQEKKDRTLFHSHPHSHLSNDDLVGPKGPIFNTAKIAGIMAAKKTSDWIPLCHPLSLSSVDVTIALEEATRSAVIRCTCRVTDQTGVEMEALTGATVAALTIYDMCKAVSHDITIQHTRLIQKSGGKRVVDHDATTTPMDLE